MKVKIKILVLLVVLLAPLGVLAQGTDQYITAEVLEVVEEGTNEVNGVDAPYQVLKLELRSGEEEGHVIDYRHGQDLILNRSQIVEEGDKVIVNKFSTPDGDEYLIVERHRMNGVIWAFAIFFLLTLIFAGKKGVGAIIGLAFSIFILIVYVVPAIINGANPLLTSIVGSVLIVFFGLYLAHGFNRQTSLAVGSTIITLVLGALMAVLFVNLTKLFGLGSEESTYLQNLGTQVINLKGLLLGGIIIGTLGVLDDITTAQTAAIKELKAANNSYGFIELFERGLRIGKEHIASLVNTLALAYVGASLPLLVFFGVKEEGPSLLLNLNSEFVVEEIIRTLVGSTALVLAVPIATAVAAWYYGKQIAKK